MIEHLLMFVGALWFISGIAYFILAERRKVRERTQTK